MGSALATARYEIIVCNMKACGKPHRGPCDSNSRDAGKALIRPQTFNRNGATNGRSQSRRARPSPSRIITRVEKDSEDKIEIVRFTVMKWPLNQIKSLPTPATAAAFLKCRRRSLIALAALIATAALIAGWTVKRRADREFEAARVLSEARAFAPFEKEARRAFAGDEVKLIQSSRAARGLAQFNGSVFAATDGGLVEFDEDGKTKRRYTTLDGLPESDLTSIAVFNSKLFIGSRSQGLIVFDGKRFERYRWTDRDAQAVTVLLEDRGRLLIGTFAGGLLEFDGRRFREIKISTASGSEQWATDQFTSTILLTLAGPNPNKKGKDAWPESLV